MEYRTLGAAGPTVSAIALGCEPLGGVDWGHIDRADAERAVQTAWDAGVTTFDTADVYGLGESERRLARALGTKRNEAVVISKFGMRWRSRPNQRAETWRCASPQYLARALEGSLRRLRVDRIPVYLVHWPDDTTRLEETMAALEQHQRDGKIGMYGVSNFSGSALQTALQEGAAVASFPLNLLDRSSESDLPLCRSARAGVAAYGAYAQGLLCGQYSRRSRFDSSDRRHRLPQFASSAWDANERLLGVIGRIASTRDVSRAQVALQWVLHHDDVSCAVVSAKRPSQITDSIAACTWALTRSELTELELTSTEHPT